MPIRPSLRIHTLGKHKSPGKDDEEEVEVHIWEKSGKVLLEALWFKAKQEVYKS